MVLEAQCEAIKTLRRRADWVSERVDRVWTVLSTLWCEEHGIRVDMLRVPKELGGLGLEPAGLKVMRAVPPLPRVAAAEGVVPVRMTTTRADDLTKKAAGYGVALSAERAQQLAESQLRATLASDDIPRVSAGARATWREQIKTYRPVLSVVCEVERVHTTLELRAWSPRLVEAQLAELRKRAPRFGSCPEVATARADYSLFRPGLTMREWLTRWFPRAAAAVKQFGPGWHMSERLDYLEGRLPSVTTRLHPALKNMWDLYTAGSLRARGRNRGFWCSASSLTEGDVAISELSQLVYWW